MVALALTGCGGGGSSDRSGANAEVKWTYMVYIAADTDISAAARFDINEMETVGSGSDVNIVVQVDFSPDDSPGDTSRGKIVQDSDQGIISSDLAGIGKKDMTDPQTLTEFIVWAAANYPAQNYALVLWSHGAGWKSTDNFPALTKGMIKDDTDAPGEIMSLQELAGAVLSSGVDLDLINFDTCLMGMYEVAYEFRGLAEAITFSEERYPVYGDAYDVILQELTLHPDMSAYELAQTITSACRQYYAAIGQTMTKSAIDMSHIDQMHTRLNSLAGVMNTNMDAERSNIQSARDESLSYDFPDQHDLGDFLEKLDENTDNVDMEAAIQQVRETMSALVISNEVYASSPINEIYRSHGLAVFLPAADQVSAPELASYALLACNQPASFTWGAFVEELVNGDTTSPAVTVEGDFVVRIEWDTDADLDLYIIEPSGNIASPALGTDSGIYGLCSLDSDDTGLSMEYYDADASVEDGDYAIWVHYYNDGPSSSTPATVSCSLRDPPNGINTYSFISQRVMGSSNPIPPDWSGSEDEISSLLNNEYSNWWYVGLLNR
jgi:hypothetical protein